MWSLDAYPLAEEIGNPNLFVGREQEMKRLLQWAEDTKPRNVKSLAMLSRRKKGKTALLQRFYNILYMRNDPRLIPFYYRIPETIQTKWDFSETFYRRVLTQYFAFTTRTPKWVRQVLPMATLYKLVSRLFYVDHDTSVEIDLHAVHENDDGTDLMIEVKDWEKGPPLDVVRRFIEDSLNRSYEAYRPPPWPARRRRSQRAYRPLDARAGPHGESRGSDALASEPHAMLIEP